MTAPTRLVLRGGTIATSDGMREADVEVANGLVTKVGAVVPRRTDRVIECGGRLVLPGFVDAHSHADARFVDAAVQRALLRQGVTSIITGQDGVSFAPGDGTFSSEYFAAINGEHSGYEGGGVAGYLASVDGASRLNVAYLVPAGTVRWEVCGRTQEHADPTQLRRMMRLTRMGMREGAVGLSTGLDYVPGSFQPADEIAALCDPVARAGGVYVTHMRGGYETNSAAGIAEIAEITELTREKADADLRVHISHFHAPPEILIGQLDALARAGIDATFDAYPYGRGCSLLSMLLLPPELSIQPTGAVIRTLADPVDRERLRQEWIPQIEQNPGLGPEWPDMVSFAHIAAPSFGWAHGLTVAQAAASAGCDAADLAFDVLIASALRVNVVMAVRHPRTVSELARIFADSRHMGGSDGIFVGAHPHPRARGTFAKFLRDLVVDQAIWSWSDAARHLAATPAARFSLGARGHIAPGWIADLAVVDPDAVADTATYDRPLGEAVGIDDVIVAGTPVLVNGELASTLAGRGLRRSPTPRWDTPHAAPPRSTQDHTTQDPKERRQ
ncbi:N-acyl-D-amino-acid deacylase [Microbacterium natoriense]|uniref:N-acyl-D-amino-acid deacylase n=1 Tax=Microbacterium natoriense TaxID=284570 RepID=A0AAW8EVJ8_9MICO|nr:amidohydrolase family protein [Microbacterium natoriense]MDQ0646216.1 N-acyl-D-amino-acid deacylase [Microbacterium natoriense]